MVAGRLEEEVDSGACCCDTFCSSAASCLGSTPGDLGGLSPRKLTHMAMSTDHHRCT